MPRKAKTVTVEIPEDEFETREIEADQMEPDVMNLMAQLGEDVAKVHIYRRLKGEKDRYVGVYDAETFDVEEIARDYGGGKYMAKLADANHRWVKGIMFYIDESRTPHPKPVATADGGLGVGRESVVDKLLTAALARMLEPPPPPPPPPDPIAIVTALAAANSKGAESALAMMQPVMDRLSRGGGEKTTAGEVVELLEKGASLFGGRESDSWMSMARELGKPLLAVMDKYIDTLKANPAARQALTGAPGNEVADPWAIIATWVPKVVALAQQGADAKVVAQMIYDNAPPLSHWLEDAVMQPGFEGALYQRFPELTGEPAVRAFVRELLVEFTEPEEKGGEHEEGADV